MTPNIGTIDKAVRTIIAFVILGTYFAGLLSGTLAIVLLAICLVFFVTSIFNFCPIYAVFGISTTGKE